MQRLVFAALVAMLIVIVLGPIVIPMLKRLKFGQTERNDGPQSHLVKSGTPTMGGIMMLIGIIVATLLFAQGTEFALFALPATFVFGLVGFLDDFIKVKKKRSLGLKPYQKIIAQVVFAAVIAVYAYQNELVGPVIYMPLIGTDWNMGVFYIPFIMFVVLAIVNAVNLTDGLDGLASGVSSVYSLVMALIFTIVAGRAANAGQVLYSRDLSGMAVFAAAVLGSCLGFLKHNSYPAKVFMGDTGSLALGGAIAMMAIYSKAVLLLPIMGGCFVASAVSVILQVGSYKLRGKRIFRMAPLHHHFELKGMSETRIVVMYMLVTVFLCLICLLAYL